MLSRAILSKIHHHLLTNDYIRHQHITEGDKHDVYVYLGKGPGDLTARHRHSNILRLSSAVEILHGQQYNRTPAHRLDAYVYQALNVATSAFDGADGSDIEDFRSLLMLESSINNTFCYCEQCPVGTTVLNHIHERAGELPRQLQGRVAQVGLGQEAKIFSLEQIWLDIPKVHIPDEDQPWDRWEELEHGQYRERCSSDCSNLDCSLHEDLQPWYHPLGNPDTTNWPYDVPDEYDYDSDGTDPDAENHYGLY
ncbi:unnamed protein product [Cylicostephanus goldi]|uniref:Uncharacterized protein n=1 Tax=Cylicostephanus goldi TaxID=71465 RepID=A0A3P6R9E7_CYLGO|nr:unnamed protein product [Cylicostephanus goldi]